MLLHSTLEGKSFGIICDHLMCEGVDVERFSIAHLDQTFGGIDARQQG